jgi:hypothetical protein
MACNGPRVLAPIGEITDELRLGVCDQAVAEEYELRQLLLRQSQYVPEHPDRDRRSELMDEVELIPSEGALEAMTNDMPQPFLVPTDGFRSEVGGEQPTVLAVLRRIEFEEVSPCREHIVG